MDRRRFLQTMPAVSGLGASGLIAAEMPESPGARASSPSSPSSAASSPSRVLQHVVVIGAGAFGGWTALHLLRRGMRVTLLDAWGPGNARSSSGGETRVTRHAYTSRLYVEMVARAISLWKESAVAWREPIFHRTGTLFFAPNDDFVGRAHRVMQAADVEHEVLTGGEVGRRFPEINADDIASAVWEPAMGFLLARRGCAAVVRAFAREGGSYRTAEARPGRIEAGRMEGLPVSDGTTLTADQYVFACGPWLGTLFPEVVGELITPTRQEVFYFGLPPGDGRFAEERFPVWADLGEQVWYGIPGNEHRGFKIALDDRGPAFDPTNGDRTPSPEMLEAARSYLAFRFPALAGAPLLEARVCQYEDTPDHDLIVDRHPEAGNVWLVGGGSGHGYKLGPALGEATATWLLEEQPLEPAFRLDRFSQDRIQGTGSRDQ